MWNRWHRRSSTLANVLVLGLVLALCSAPHPARGQVSAWSPIEQSTPPIRVLRLVDGSTIRGTLVEEAEGYVVIDNRVLGKIRVPREHIDSILDESEKEVAAPQSFDPDYNSVLFGPTPETLPKGTTYFRSFEVLVLNFGHAVTNDLNLSLATLFPVSADVGMVSGGFKYRLLSRERHHVGLAASGTGTYVSESWLATLSGIVGIGNRRRSLNVSFHEAFVEGEKPGPFYIVSADVQFAPSAKLLAEFGNSANRVLDDEDINGFINVGFRMFWARTTFTLTGFRPLTDDTDGFIAFPVAMFARHW